MMKKKSMTSLLIFLIFFISFPLAMAEFPFIAHNDSVADAGVWNSDSLPVSTNTRDGTFNFPPLVADFDNDSTTEIAMIDISGTPTLYIYTSTDNVLSIESTIQLNGSGNAYAYAYDYDGDDLVEIMVGSSNANVDILQLNNSVLAFQDSFALSPHSGEGETIIACKSTEHCVAVWNNDLDAASHIYGSFFNSTGVFTSGYIVAGGGSTQQCLTQLPYIAVADYDADNTIEYAITNIGKNAATTDTTVYVRYFVDNSTAGIDLEQTVTETNVAQLPAGASDSHCDACNYVVGSQTICTGQVASSPLVRDLEGSPQDGLETVIGVVTSVSGAGNFKMYSYKTDGSDLDDYPELFTADGYLLSNPMAFYAFPGGSQSGRDQFCVVGYDNEQQSVDLLCASEQVTVELTETHEFFWNATFFESGTLLPWNTTNTYGNYESLAFASQQSSEPASIGGNNYNFDELVGTYGVFSIFWSGISNSLQPIFGVGVGVKNAAVVISDINEPGRADMLLQTDTNLWLYDDGWSNSDPDITELYFDPCPDELMLNNTIFEARVTVDDDDYELTGDKVRAQFTIYKDEANEQASAWTSYGSPGTTFTMTNIVNVTTSSSVFEVRIQDDSEGSRNSTYTGSFAVGAGAGVQHGETNCEVVLEDEDEEEVGNLTTTVTDNAIDNALDAIYQETGIGKTLLWLIIIFILMVAVWFEGGGSPIALGAMGMILMMGIITGYFLGFIGGGLVTIFVIFSVAVSAIYLHKIFIGQ